MPFHVNENHSKNWATIHRSDCVHCKYGKGPHRKGSTFNSKWLGPFNSREDVEKAAVRTGKKVVQWCRRCADGKRLTTMTEKQIAYWDFWTGFLPEFRQRYPGWERKTATESEHHMDFDAGLSGLHYSVNFCRPDNQPWFRVELYVDARNKDKATARFEALMQGREAIEARFGAPLEWDPLPNRKAGRIASYFPAELSVEERVRWAELRVWAIERLGALRDAFRPHIEKLS